LDAAQSTITAAFWFLDGDATLDIIGEEEKRDDDGDEHRGYITEQEAVQIRYDISNIMHTQDNKSKALLAPPVRA